MLGVVRHGPGAEHTGEGGGGGGGGGGARGVAGARCARVGNGDGRDKIVVDGEVFEG